MRLKQLMWDANTEIKLAEGKCCTLTYLSAQGYPL